MYLHCVSGVYIIPYDVIKLLSVLGRGYVVVRLLFVLPPLRECGLCLLFMLL